MSIWTLLAIIVIIVAAVYAARATKEKENEKFIPPYVPPKSQELTYEIRGIKYRNLAPSIDGPFKGYIKAELNNPYDKFAVGVYNENDLLLGYLPREKNRPVHKALMEDGNKKYKVTGFIEIDGLDDKETDYDDYDWYGEVTIK